MKEDVKGYGADDYLNKPLIRSVTDENKSDYSKKNNDKTEQPTRI
jgi:hypothetical protein